MTDKQDRQIEILQILRCKRQTKVCELAKKLHVSRATILRDLEDLSRAQYPICVLPGRNGGISVMDGCEIYIPAMKTVHEQFLKSLLPRLQPGEQEIMEEILRTYSHKKYL